MPEISRFCNMVISMRYSDNEQHNKPHVHVASAEHRASISLEGELLAGWLPRKQLHIVRGWIALHEDELYEAWNKAIRDIPIGKIAPLQ